MELNVSVGPTASPKREFHSLKQKSLKSNLMESIAKVNSKAVVSQFNADGTVRLKLLVRKQDLKQIIEAARSGIINVYHHQQFHPTFSSIEQRLSVFRRKHLMKARKESYRRGSWTPALQTIPEEL